MKKIGSRTRILLQTTPRAWRWRAECDDHRVAGDSGIFGRVLSPEEAIQYAKIKAQKWMVNNDLREAEIVIAPATGGLL